MLFYIYILFLFNVSYFYFYYKNIKVPFKLFFKSFIKTLKQNVSDITDACNRYFLCVYLSNIDTCTLVVYFYKRVLANMYKKFCYDKICLIKGRNPLRNAKFRYETHVTFV